MHLPELLLKYREKGRGNMVETVVSVELPAGEYLKVVKNVIKPIVVKGNEKRVCIVTGIHGDELEGQYVCYELNRLLKERLEYLQGIVEIYPALNPLGLDSYTRGIPGFDLDMNRIFPGTGEGSVPEHVAHMITESIKGAALCIDIHASSVFLREVPQVRLNGQSADVLLPLAKRLNVDYIWISSAATVLESTLSYSLNQAGVPALVVEMGVGMGVTEAFCHQLVAGIFVLLKDMGIWTGEVTEPRKPRVSGSEDVFAVWAEKPGLFLPEAANLSSVKKGSVIGRILGPLEGTLEEVVYAPVDGMIFTMREYPVVAPGSLLARVLADI